MASNGLSQSFTVVGVYEGALLPTLRALFGREERTVEAIELSHSLDEMKRLLEDAARYRWLKSQPEFFRMTIDALGLSVDEAIDLMRSQTRTH